MLDFLVTALFEARDRAGVSLDEVAFRGRQVSLERGEEVLIDRGYLSRLETGKAGWSPKIDAVVRGYAAACGTTDLELWAQALEAYGREEGRLSAERARRQGRARKDE